MGERRSGAEPGRRLHNRAAVRDRERIDHARPVAAKVVRGQHAARGPHVGASSRASSPFSRSSGPDLGDPLQRRLEPAERQVADAAVRVRRGRQAVGQIDRARRFEPAQLARREGDPQAGVPVDRQAGLGERDRGRAELRPGQARVALEREREPGRLARHRDRERARDIAVVLHRGPAEQVAIPQPPASG